MRNVFVSSQKIPADDTQNCPVFSAVYIIHQEEVTTVFIPSRNSSKRVRVWEEEGGGQQGLRFGDTGLHAQNSKETVVPMFCLHFISNPW